MKINQGLTLIFLSIIGISFFHLIDADSMNSIFFFLFGFSLARFEKFWEIKKSKKQKGGAK
jgi:hypothetical protein